MLFISETVSKKRIYSVRVRFFYVVRVSIHIFFLMMFENYRITYFYLTNYKLVVANYERILFLKKIKNG